MSSQSSRVHQNTFVAPSVNELCMEYPLSSNIQRVEMMCDEFTLVCLRSVCDTDQHHLFWPERDAAGEIIATTFRNLPDFKQPICRFRHELEHKEAEPLRLPDIELMVKALDHHDKREALARYISRTVGLKQSMLGSINGDVHRRRYNIITKRLHKENGKRRKLARSSQELMPLLDDVLGLGDA